MSAWGAAHAFVAQALATAGLQVRVLHVLPGHDPARAPLWQRVAAHPWQSVSGRLREAFLRAPLHRVETEVREALFPDGQPRPQDLDAAPLQVPAYAVNAPTTVRDVRALAPDVLLTSGAPLLRQALRTAVGTAWNLHWGVAPAYRGGHTLFHALRRGDEGGIGFTLHTLQAGADTGAIVHQEILAPDARRTEAGAWIGCARAAAAALPALLRVHTEATAAARPQAGSGHLYRYRDRTVLRQVAWGRAERRRARRDARNT